MCKNMDYGAVAFSADRFKGIKYKKSAENADFNVNLFDKYLVSIAFCCFKPLNDLR